MTRTSHFKIPTPKTTKPDHGGKRYVPPIIPLERPAETQHCKDQFLTFKLRSNPTDDASTTYDLSIPFFSTGSAEELLIFIQMVNRVISGQNVTDGPGRYALICRLLSGDALTAFNSAATAAGNETIPHYKMAVQGLISHVFPH